MIGRRVDVWHRYWDSVTVWSSENHLAPTCSPPFPGFGKGEVGRLPPLPPAPTC